MQVNGEQVKLDTPVSVADYLEAHGFRAERVAIELNGEIIPRDKCADAMLDDQCVMKSYSLFRVAERKSYEQYQSGY